MAAVVLVGGVGVELDLVVFFEAPLGLLQALGPRAGDRARLPRALVIQAPARVAQPALPALRRRERLGQLVAARVAETLVLFGVDGVGVLEDLARDLLVIAGGVMRRVGLDLGAVDGDHADADQPRLGAQPQHLAEQLRQRVLVALAKARDRRVIRRAVGADHARGDILDAATLDPPRRALPDRVAVKQQRHHHRRLVRRAGPAHPADSRVERRQIKPLDGVDHKPRQMPGRQPLAQARRQQQHLIAVALQEVRAHAPNRLNRPGQTPSYATATATTETPSPASDEPAWHGSSSPSAARGVGPVRARVSHVRQADRRRGAHPT